MLKIPKFSHGKNLFIDNACGKRMLLDRVK